MSPFAHKEKSYTKLRFYPVKSRWLHEYFTRASKHPAAGKLNRQYRPTVWS